MKSKPLRILCVSLIAVVALSFVAGINPFDNFNTLEDLQTALPKNFYYFNVELEPPEDDRITMYLGITNRITNCGKFKYIGYEINHVGFNVIATSNKRDLKTFNEKNTKLEKKVLDGIICYFGTIGVVPPISLSDKAILYFELDSILYSFSTSNSNTDSFLSICESAIKSKYTPT